MKKKLNKATFLLNVVVDSAFVYFFWLGALGIIAALTLIIGVYSIPLIGVLYYLYTEWYNIKLAHTKWEDDRPEDEINEQRDFVE